MTANSHLYNCLARVGAMLSCLFYATTVGVAHSHCSRLFSGGNAGLGLAWVDIIFLDNSFRWLFYYKYSTAWKMRSEHDNSFYWDLDGTLLDSYDAIFVELKKHTHWIGL